MSKTVTFSNLEEAQKLYPEIKNNYGKSLSKGEKFNELTVLYRTISTKYRDSQYICECSCEKFCLVSKSNLIRGITKSCGHLRGNKQEDLSIYKFGKLTPLFSEKRNNRYYWYCNCDCGGKIWVKASHLKDSSIQSCGCLKSVGEEKVSNLLKENNITFIKQDNSLKCIFPNTNHKAFFDFAIYDDNNNLSYLIEYDGMQHFQYNKNNSGWNNKENFEKNIYRDEYKNQWCKENNIPLIRIPYTHLNDLCLQDLQLETSKFIV